MRYHVAFISFRWLYPAGYLRKRLLRVHYFITLLYGGLCLCLAAFQRGMSAGLSRLA